jgi:hypothetical protein
MGARFVGALSIEVIENSICFLGGEKTQNFDTGQMIQKWLRLEGFSRYDFELESIFKLLLGFQLIFQMQYECMMPCNMSALYIPYHNKKSSPNIDDVCIVSGNLHSSL